MDRQVGEAVVGRAEVGGAIVDRAEVGGAIVNRAEVGGAIVRDIVFPSEIVLQSSFSFFTSITRLE